MEKVVKVCQDFLSDLEGYFTRILDFTWRVSDCEELVGHPFENIGINASNYFMYNGWGQCAPLLCYSVKRQSLEKI